MIKYQTLKENLAGLSNDKITLAYKVIENILGSQLPKTTHDRTFWEKL